jgi:poly(3-hydroxybutyrate) depolymerase
MRSRSVSFVSLLAASAVFALAACDAGSPGSSGTAGSTGSAGSTGTAGTTGGGTAGDTGGGTAGTTGGGTAGNGGSTGGSTAGTTGGTAGAAGGGTAGAAGGGAAGTSGGAGSGGATSPGGGKSAGCGKDLGAGDMPGKWIKKNVTVTGVTFATAPTGGGSWTNRIYYLNLPANYDSSKAYPVIFGGGGCGGDLNNGNMAFAIYGGNQANAIQIGMSYVWPQGGGACFADGFADTPDLQYFDSMLKELSTNYCVDTGHVFVGGYSSGGWESYMLGLARGGVVRGISPAAGGLRADGKRPPPANKPFAAFMVTGASDTANPAEGPTGSMAARDLILKVNGCTGTATEAYADYVGGNCQKYTGCPADYPVIYCRPAGGHTDGGGAFKTAIGKLWMQLK